jgi:hypothetical protein
MLHLRTHARALSLLGVIITVLLLLGISCGSGTIGTSDVGKSVSTTHTASGYCWNDQDQDGVKDAGEPGWNGIWVAITRYQGDPDSVIADDYTDSDGYYEIAYESYSWLGTMYLNPLIGPLGYTWWSPSYRLVYATLDYSNQNFSNHAL